jgi:hypothetical protein
VIPNSNVNAHFVEAVRRGRVTVPRDLDVSLDHPSLSIPSFWIGGMCIRESPDFIGEAYFDALVSQVSEQWESGSVAVPYFEYVVVQSCPGYPDLPDTDPFSTTSFEIIHMSGNQVDVYYNRDARLGHWQHKGYRIHLYKDGHKVEYSEIYKTPKDKEPVNIDSECLIGSIAVLLGILNSNSYAQSADSETPFLKSVNAGRQRGKLQPLPRTITIGQDSIRRS